MKQITFNELEKNISYNDYTAFVYNDGTQTMYSGGEITEDSLSHFEETDDITLYRMEDIPEIKQIMQENLLAEFEPAEDVENEGYDMMVKQFANNEGQIAMCEYDNNRVYMLVW